MLSVYQCVHVLSVCTCVISVYMCYQCVRVLSVCTCVISVYMCYQCVHVSLYLQRLRSDATLHDAQQRTQTTLLLEEVLHEVFTSDSELRITSSHVNITMGR